MAKNDSTPYSGDLFDSADGTDVCVPVVTNMVNAPEATDIVDVGIPEANDNADVVVKKGAALLGLYKVESDPIEGGMGRVWRVRHTGWNVDLAMKQLLDKWLQNKSVKENFEHECRAWIDLGLHPNIVSCHYFREIGGVLSIFAEWMDGGSLKDKIEDKSLYEGGDAEVVARILDIAIQFARGLHYAHEQGLTHQDAKPANLLLTKTGEAKVADFGIARALATDAEAPIDGTMVSEYGGGYSPHYRSPEQKPGWNLTRRTDIWSWAVSVLEMFIGERSWEKEEGKSIVYPACDRLCEEGTADGYAWEKYSGKEKIAIPEAMKDLLRRCFQKNEADRPDDFGVVEAELLEIYKAETGRAYPRPVPKAAPNFADSLNNRALSFLDLGKPDEAEKYWEQALAITPNHAESLYNQSVHLWMKARINYMQALRRLSENRTDMTDYYLAKIHLSRCDAESAIECLKKAKETLGDAEDIKRAMTAAEGMIKNGEDWGCTSQIDFEIDSVDLFPPVCISPDGKTVILGDSRDNTVKLWNIATGKLVRILEGTWSPICISPDGETIISGCEYGMINLWNIATGEHIRTFEGDSIESVCISPDGKNALSGGEDGTIKLWDIATGRCLRTFEGYHVIVKSICFSPDGNAALSFDNYQAKLWNIATGECVCDFSFEEARAGSVCFSPDGKTVLSGDLRAPKLWDVATGQCIRAFEADVISVESDRDVISVCCFSPDGKTALSSGEYGTIKLWNIETGECIRTFVADPDVISVCFSPDGKTAFSSSDNGTINLWDVETGQCLHTFESCLNVISACFSPDGKAVLSLGYNYYSSSPPLTFKRWSITARPRYEMVQSRITTIETALSNAAELDSLIARTDALLNKGDVDGALVVLAEPTEKYILDNSAYHAAKKRAAVAKLDSYSLVDRTDALLKKGDVDGALAVLAEPTEKYVLDSSTYHSAKKHVARYCVLCEVNCLTPAKSLAHGVDSFCISPDGKTALSGSSMERIYSGNEVIYSGGEDGTIKLWDIATGQRLRTFEGHKNSVESVCISPDGKTALSCGMDLTISDIGDIRIIVSENSVVKGTIKLWNMETGECIRTFEGRKYTVDSVCFSPDGKTALSRCRDIELSRFYGGETTIKLWNMETGECIRTFEGRKYTVDSICFSPDGKTALSSCRDVELSRFDGETTIKLWNIETGECIRIFEGHRGSVVSICFSTDGKTALSKGMDGIKLWNIATGEHIRIFEGHRGFVKSVCFSPDGKTVLSCEYDGTIELWNIATGEPIRPSAFEGQASSVRSVCFSPDGAQILVAATEEILIYYVDYKLHFPGWADWNEGALPYVQNFLIVHPDWTDEDFNNILIRDLQNRGYGWLRPEGVKAELLKISEQAGIN